MMEMSWKKADTYSLERAEEYWVPILKKGEKIKK